jgi:hypothetical protein
VPLTRSSGFPAEANRILIEWITRMQMVLNLETTPILSRLMIDEKNIDGTVLQLTTFILQEFFRSSAGGQREVPFEKLHPLTASILQAIFEPFVDEVEKILFERRREEQVQSDRQGGEEAAS